MHFRFIYRRALIDSYTTGALTKAQHETLMEAIRRPRRRKLNGEQVDLMAEIEKYTMANTPKSGNIIKAIYDWLVENWDKILKMILMLLPLFLKEPEGQDACETI
jgi:hypothetical protein